MSNRRYIYYKQKLCQVKNFCCCNLFENKYSNLLFFLRYWEKQEEELNEQVEYDLDDEDLNWLDEVNQGRNEKGNRPIELADMAQMMDRLEKESFFQLSSTNDQRNQMKVNDSGETSNLILSEKS